jgi:hypothetical protein
MVIFRRTSGVGTGEPEGARPPQVLPSALFPGAKCLFLREKGHYTIAFFYQSALLKLECMLFPEIFFNFLDKYHISGNFLVYPENFFNI